MHAENGWKCICAIFPVTLHIWQSSDWLVLLHSSLRYLHFTRLINVITALPCFCLRIVKAALSRITFIHNLINLTSVLGD
jgi:hypothetical protein